jgi:serine/threonine protein kinase
VRTVTHLRPSYVRTPPLHRVYDLARVTERAPIQSGDILVGKYCVEEVIGSGGMGHVVAVRHVRLDERFAVKVMRREHVNDPNAIARFEREARAAVKLRSAHAARVHDVGTTNEGAPYIVMELLQGASIRGLLKQRKKLDPNESALLIAQACEAVGEAHALGMVHRDIKPSNLFLTFTPTGKPCIKVLDFGIVKSIDGVEEATLTKTHAPIGSPRYMAPEQIGAAKTVDRRSDVWSLGATLYEMVTGQPPFKADNLLELGAKILHEDVVDPRTSTPECPDAIAELIMRCLEKTPDLRYKDARELRQAIDDAVGGIDFATSSSKLGAVVAPTPRRHTPTQPLTPAGVAGIDTMMTPTPPLLSAPHPATTAPFQPDSSPMFAAAPVAPTSSQRMMPAPPPSSNRSAADDTGSQNGRTNLGWGEPEPAGRAKRPSPVPYVIGILAVVAAIGGTLAVVSIRQRAGHKSTAEPPPAVAVTETAASAAPPPPPLPSPAAEATTAPTPSATVAVVAPTAPPPPPRTAAPKAIVAPTQVTTPKRPPPPSTPKPPSNGFDRL